MYKKAFTLIELLFVVALISVLSAIIMVSINAARDRAKDTAAKENMINLRSISELYYLENGNSYLNFCDLGGDAEPSLVEASSATGLTTDCNVDGGGKTWAAEVGLIEGGYFCIDTRSGGKKRNNSIAPGGDTVCPAI